MSKKQKSTPFGLSSKEVLLSVFGTSRNVNMKSGLIHARTISLAAILIALGVAISPYLWFPIMESKAYPGQHIVNAVAGVLLGPLWAALIAFFIGIIRMSLGVGTIFSIPGGIPGAVVVGLVGWLIKRTGYKQFELASLSEPLGTILIGGTLAVYLFAPIVGRSMLLIPVWVGWSLSSIPGAIVGFVILKALRGFGFARYFVQ